MTTMWAGAEGYDQLMGRWDSRLAPLLIESAEVKDGDRVLDMGYGTGSLTRAAQALAWRVKGRSPIPPSKLCWSWFFALTLAPDQRAESSSRV